MYHLEHFQCCGCCTQIYPHTDLLKSASIVRVLGRTSAQVQELRGSFSMVICITSMHLDVMFLTITLHRPVGLGALIMPRHKIGPFLISSRAEVGMVRCWLNGAT